MFLHALFQLGIQTVAPRKSQTEEDKQKEKSVSPKGETPFAHIRIALHASRRVLSRPARTRQAFYIPVGRQHAPQHPSLSFIHDRSLRYGI